MCHNTSFVSHVFFLGYLAVRVMPQSFDKFINMRIQVVHNLVLSGLRVRLTLMPL